MAADPRDIRIAEQQAQLAARDKVIAELMAKVEALTARVAELEAKLGQNSTNSSKPPSSDPPGVTRPPRPPSGRRPGGQPGHKHHKRELVPPEQVTRFVDLPAPEKCRRCSRRLKGKPVPPLRSQVTEVPPVKPDVTEYRQHGRECDDCCLTTYAELPEEARHTFGPRLTAIGSLLSGKYRLSKRLAQSLLSDLLGVRIALGSVSNRDMEVSDALAVPYTEAERAIQDADVAHADESGWAEGKVDGHKKRAWLWVVVTTGVTLFCIAYSRGGEVAKGLLGEGFTGNLVTDRWGGYNWVDLALRQLCWSHLTRDWQSFIDRGGESARIGALLMKHRHKMFKWWHRVRDGTMPRAEFQRRMAPVRREVGRLLREAEVCPNGKTKGMAKEILKLEPAMWTFVDVEGVQPTNNTAEQAIRYGVIYRKTSFGTQSPAGSRFVERILTTIATLRQQNRNVLEYLTDAIRAHRCGLPAPALLPEAVRAQLAEAA